MKQATIPLSIPADLHRKIKQGAKATRLSQADVMRHIIRIGLRQFVAAFPKPETRVESPAAK